MGQEKRLNFVQLGVMLAAGGLLAVAVGKLGRAWPPHGANAVPPPGAFSGKSALATGEIKQAIALAGFGLPRMEALRKGGGPLTDTLTVFSNESGGGTTLSAASAAGDSVIRVAANPGFFPGCHLGIDGKGAEYARIAKVEADGAGGFRLSLCGPLKHPHAFDEAETGRAAGLPKVFPARRDVYFVDAARHALVDYRDGALRELAPDIREFRVQLRDQFGAVTASMRNVKAVSFSLAGLGAAATGVSGPASISSTAIARNSH